MVTGLSINDINMIFEMRMLYEPYVILNYGSLMPEKKLAEFYNIFCNTKINENFAEKKDYYYDLDTDFHSMIIHSCPNIYIHQNYNLISTQDIRFRHMTGDCSVSRLEETFKEHLAIITPCIQKNWEEAAEKCVEETYRSPRCLSSLTFDKYHGNLRKVGSGTFMLSLYWIAWFVVIFFISFGYGWTKIRFFLEKNTPTEES